MDVDVAMQYGGAAGARSAVIIREVADTELVRFIQTFMYSFLKLYFQPVSTFTIFICRYLYKVLS